MELWELEARESIRHTIATYTAAGDKGQLEGMAACFTPNGLMKIGDDEPIIGRDAIVATMKAVLPSERRPTHAHHHVSSTLFSRVDPEGVDSSSYFTVMTDCGPDHWGAYRDRFVPEGGQWLIASRKIRVYGFAEDSYFRPT
jgi:uncharacterized protein (TIGR02246 family)